MDFGEILSKAWKITWKYKVLWIFGILAGCAEGGGSGGGGNSSFNGGSGNRMPGGNFPGANLPPQIEQMANWVRDNVALFVIAICLFVLLFTAIRVFFGTIGRIGLIHGATRADQEDAPVLTFGDVFTQSRRYFWRIFGIDLLVGVVSFVIVLAILAAAVLPLIPAIASGAGENSNAFGGGMVAFFIILFACLCCIFFPISIVAGLVLQMVYTAIVIDNLSVGDGIRKGWEVFKSNLGNFLLMWLLLVILGGIVGFIIGLPMIAAFAPMLIALAGGETALRTGIIGSLVCCAVYLPVLLVLSGILRTYVQSGWTLVYLRLTGRPAYTPAAPAIVEAL